MEHNNTRNATLDGYVQEFDQLKHTVGDANVASVILQERAKDRRTREIRDERKVMRGVNEVYGRTRREVRFKGEPATAKQLDFLKQLGMAVPAGLTRQAASELIDIGLEKRREQ